MQKRYSFLVTLIAVACSTVPLTSIAQGVDCGKAPSTAEQYQCANNELSTAERDLEAAFADAIRHYTPNADETKEDDLPQPQKANHAAYESKMRQSLELSQKLWLQYRSAACAPVSDLYEGGTMGPTALALCKAEIE